MLRLFLLLLVFWGLNVNLIVAQDPAARIDSLRAVLRTAQPDTARGRTLGRLGGEFVSVQEWDSAYHYGGLALEAGARLRDTMALALGHAAIGFGLILNGYDDSSLYHNQRAVDYFRIMGEHKLASNRSNLVAMAFQNNGRYAEAVEIYKQNIRIQEADGDSMRLAGTLNNLGNVYESMHQLPRALQVYQKALRLNRLMGNDAWAARNLMNIGLIYDHQGDWAKSLESNYQALEIYNAIQDTQEANSVLYNIAYVFISMDSLDKAMRILKENAASTFYLNQNSDNAHSAGIYHAIGQIFHKQNQIDSAKFYIMRAYEINQNFVNVEWMTSNCLEMGSIEFETGRYPAAMQWLEKAVLMADTLHNPSNLAEALRLLSKTYSKVGRTQDALFALERYVAVRDSLANENLSRQLGQLETRYEMEEEAEQAAAAEAQIREAANARNNQQYLLIFASLSFLLLIGGLLLRFRVPTKWVKGILFLTMLLIFETVFIFIDPYLTHITDGVPIQKLMINALLVVTFTFIHQAIDGRLIRRRLVAQEQAAKQRTEDADADADTPDA